jgi:hypothetical protein
MDLLSILDMGFPARQPECGIVGTVDGGSQMRFTRAGMAVL